jgi:hypothetical protein
MRTISDKRRKIYGQILIMTSIGLAILTYYFIDSTNGRDSFDTMAQFINKYCIFNTALTFISGLLLLIKKIKIYNFVALLLMFSTLIALLLPGKQAEMVPFQENLFAQLTLMGTIFGATFGGFIWVPLFLFNSFYGAYKSIRYWNKKVKYEFESDIIQI